MIKFRQNNGGFFGKDMAVEGFEVDLLDLEKAFNVFGMHMKFVKTLDEIGKVFYFCTCCTFRVPAETETWAWRTFSENHKLFSAWQANRIRLAIL